MAVDTKAQSQKTVDDIFYVLFFVVSLVDIALFIGLALINIQNNVKFFIIVVYTIISFPIFYLGFFLYFKKTEFRKEDYTGLKHIGLDPLQRILVYAIPIFFSLFIINYVSIYLNIQSIVEPLNFLNIMAGYSETVPGFNFDTAMFFLLILAFQGGYLTSIPGSVAEEFKFYKAEEDFKKAKNVKYETTFNVKKFNSFLNGLDWYDKYMRKAFKHKIDRSKIFSKLVADSKIKPDSKIKEIYEAFESPDKLFPLKKMSELFNDARADELLSRISRLDTLKVAAEGLLSTIPVIVGLISFVLGIT